MFSTYSANAMEIWRLVSSPELFRVQNGPVTSSGHRGSIKCANAINGGNELTKSRPFRLIKLRKRTELDLYKENCVLNLT